MTGRRKGRTEVAREITITKAEDGFVVTKSWDGWPPGAIKKSIAVVDTPINAATAAYRFFYDDEYDEPYVLAKVPDRLEFEVDNFIRNNPE